MHDPRFDQLAAVLVGHSLNLQSKERVLVELFDVPVEMGVALVRAIRARGGIPFVQLHNGRLSRELLLDSTESQYSLLSEIELARMKQMDCYLALRGSHNITELSDVPGDRMKMAMSLMRPVLDYRIRQTRWVVLRWPTSSMAQQAGMSSEQFEDFYFKVCTVDYGRMTKGMEVLKEWMERTNRVHIKGPGTDLRFSIEGIPAIPCGGEHNIPDGEVFTCPVRESVEGHVTFNAPTVYRGMNFDNIRLTFDRGRIVDAEGSNTAKLNEILDSDEGARYIGEFSLGFHPLIEDPMRDILFDEKIAGSFHFTPGQAYEEADNGNRSQVHWDMVCIQRPEYGGGEVWFDDTLIRKDGRFVVEGLEQLNPEHLK